MDRWLQIAWGKFRSWQRVCPEVSRLSPGQLRAAWLVWDGMRQAIVLGQDGQHLRTELQADEFAAQTVELVKAMPVALRRGPAVFSHWLVENREVLSRPVVRAVAESAHARDKVSAQLIR
jgi:hypothetical protein